MKQILTNPYFIYFFNFALSPRNLNHIVVPERPIIPRVSLPGVQLRDVSIYMKDFGSKFLIFFLYVHINLRLFDVNFSQRHPKKNPYMNELWMRSSKNLIPNSSEISCFSWISLSSTFPKFE